MLKITFDPLIKFSMLNILVRREIVCNYQYLITETATIYIVDKHYLNLI